MVGWWVVGVWGAGVGVTAAGVWWVVGVVGGGGGWWGVVGWWMVVGGGCGVLGAGICGGGVGCCATVVGARAGWWWVAGAWLGGWWWMLEGGGPGPFFSAAELPGSLSAAKNSYKKVRIRTFEIRTFLYESFL